MAHDERGLAAGAAAAAAEAEPGPPLSSLGLQLCRSTGNPRDFRRDVKGMTEASIPLQFDGDCIYKQLVAAANSSRCHLRGNLREVLVPGLASQREVSARSACRCAAPGPRTQTRLGTVASCASTGDRTQLAAWIQGLRAWYEGGDSTPYELALQCDTNM